MERRKKDPNRADLFVRVPVRIKTAVEEYAAHNGISQSAAVSVLLNQVFSQIHGEGQDQ